MVRNIKGGSKHKKLARKNVEDTTVVQKARLANPDEPCEIYARVIKHYGNGMTEVICNDGIQRICIIRNKFRGRNKRNNVVNEQSIVLVGLRDWEVVASDKKQKCDLLEVYTTLQHSDIKKDEKSNWRYLRPVITTNVVDETQQNQQITYESDEDDDAFEFGDIEMDTI